MRRELETTKQYLQRTIEELQTANEELRSFNEEIQSANEELQSTNEELTTSQEELQSVSEELVTANAEILNKNEALRQANNDLNNLLVATDLATIFLRIDLSIQRFTPAAMSIVNLIDTDIGRPLRHIVSNLHNVDLIKAAERVLETLNIFEQEAETEEGRWYNLRILPYRTLDNVIDGLVMTFAEITRQKKTEIALQQLNAALQNGEFSQSIIDTLHEGLLILDNELQIESANRAFYQHFRLTRDDIVGVSLLELDEGRWDQPGLREGLMRIITENKPFENLEIEQTFAGVGPQTVRLNARRLIQLPENGIKIVLAVEDITARP
jgi:two-component system CheB/CheR fusion protein